VAGSQDYEPDPRNEAAFVYVNGALVPRSEAVVSVFDSGFSLGDGVWESFRVHQGQLPFADQHLDRLFRGAASVQIDIGLTREEVLAALRQTIEANDMTDGAHIRLMVTRGTKRSPTQDPRLVVGAATVVIVAEWKQPRPELATEGLRLFTSTVRCARPDIFDMRLNSHSRLHLITALLQAIDAGADEALMLDAGGYVSSCNSTNFFFVRDTKVFTSTGTSCFNGITRGIVIDLCRSHKIPIEIGDFTLGDAYGCDEAFVTGTFGGITPVSSIDGQPLAVAGSTTTRLRQLYARRVEQEVKRLGAAE
jgi:branched-chain amino acid aminotransferase